MKRFRRLFAIVVGKHHLLSGRRVIGSLVLLIAAGVSCTPAFGQVKESAEAGGIILSAGGTFSGYYLGYGQRKLLGPTAFIDAIPRGPLGVEAEARWLNMNETAGVHASTYLIGPKYTFKEIGRLQPYAKALVGYGKFTFPYDYAHGTYLVVAPGAGADFRINRRIYLRLIDFEYQYWPQFTYGALPSYGLSSGVRVHLF
jgi:hypothetical protein